MKRKVKNWNIICGKPYLEKYTMVDICRNGNIYGDYQANGAKPYIT